MARNRFIKTRSNYVIKDLHRSTNIGNIYERDFMTIADMNTYTPGSSPTYTLNGFKMVVDSGVSLKKKHRYGSWLKNESCGKPTTFWTLNCSEDADGALNVNHTFKIKSNYSSIFDHVYYGSAQKLIEGSIRGIIEHFPAELVLMDTYVDINGVRLYNVDNPFNIDMESIMFPDEKNDTPLRVFSYSYDKYHLLGPNGETGVLSWDRVIIDANECTPNETLLSEINLGNPLDTGRYVKLYSYNINGKKKLFHDGVFKGFVIRPTNKEITKFFNSIDDVQTALLNKKTNYTIDLETYTETEDGFISTMVSYTWPKTIGKWNIAISGWEYEKYVNGLLNVAEFCDTYGTDNMWRSMTHEAIITYDWTLTKTASDGAVEEYENPNGHRIQSFIHVAGRQFDELKKYIDGVSYANAVTYDGAKNNPDELLNDTLTNYGWDVKIPIPAKIGKYSTLALYPSHVNGYTSQDANYEFYRRLLLNTSAILAAKGTKRSIEMVLSLFGYKSLNFVEHSFHDIIEDGKVVTRHWSDINDEYVKKSILKNVYDLTEYVYVASEGSTAYEDGCVDLVKNVNSYKATYFEGGGSNAKFDELQGLPVREVLVETQVPVLGMVWDDTTNSIDTGATIGYESKFVNYLIPWFDRTKQYDGNVYFESKGGWGLMPTKTTTVDDYGDVYVETSDDLKVYDEHVSYLKFANNIDELTHIIGEYPNLNDIYYVSDITDQSKYDWGLLGNETQPTMSHYFTLKDATKDNKLGVLRDKDNNVLINENTGIFDASKYLDENDEPIYETPEEINGYPNILWGEYPEKKYGWKNISEEELKEGKSKDAQKVFYLESIVDTKVGNAPHIGKGFYDDGETYRLCYEDLFSGAKENELFDYIDDSILPWGEGFPENNPFVGRNLGFEMVKNIDNVKCWYFTDTTTNSDLFLLMENEDGTYSTWGNEVPNVGGGKFVRFYEERKDDGDGSTGIFNSSQYPVMLPYNMEGGSEDDEAAANSIVNTKALYIEFIPDLQAPDSMYEFVDDVAMHYVKQIIPSTTLFKYKVPMTGWDVFCSHRTYPQSVFFEN